MQVEVKARNRVVEEVPFVLGGIYRYEQSGPYYILNDCRKGGYQLNSTNGMVLTDGPMNTEDGMRRYLNDGPWTYIPHAKLVIEEEKT